MDVSCCLQASIVVCEVRLTTNAQPWHWSLSQEKRIRLEVCSNQFPPDFVLLLTIIRGEGEPTAARSNKLQPNSDVLAFPSDVVFLHTATVPDLLIIKAASSLLDPASCLAYCKSCHILVLIGVANKQVRAKCGFRAGRVRLEIGFFAVHRCMYTAEGLGPCDSKRGIRVENRGLLRGSRRRYPRASRV